MSNVNRNPGKHYIPCDMCATSLKPGHLWLTGNDYLVCPQCGGTQRVECIATKVQRPVKTVFMAGYKPYAEVNWNLRSLLTDKPLNQLEVPRRI